MEEIWNMVEEFECSICMDELVNPQILPCGHFFCKECKEALLKFKDGEYAILECPKKCSPVTNLQNDQTLGDVLQNVFAVESFVNKIRSQLEPTNVNCQEAHEYKITCSRYCKTCRKTSCKSCFEEHACERDNHIQISFDHPKKSFQPICKEHNTFARHICRECNDQLICIYCKHRTHKDHDIVDLDSHVTEIKSGLTAEYETAKKFILHSRQSDEKIMEHCQDIRKNLSEELLVRKIIRVNRYIAQVNEEESKILKQFDDHVDSFITQRKYKMESVAELKNLLDDQNSLHNLVMLSEQEILLEKLQDIIKQLSFKVVLSDLTNDNHLGELQFNLNQNELNSLDVKDLEFPCKIIKENTNEMLYSTDLRNAENFQDEIMKKCQKFTSEVDIHAIKKNGKEIANLRLAMAFEPKLREDFLEVAVKENQWKMLKVILEFKNVDVNTKYNDTIALMNAAEAGHSECVKLLIEHDCNIDMKDVDGNTALMWACIGGHSECVKLLIEHDCNVDMRNNFGSTALIYASGRGYSECSKLLLEHNCDIDVKNTYENTALMRASEGGHSECVKLLLERNCDIDMKNRYGQTALAIASSIGHRECVNILNQYKKLGI